MKDRIKQWLSDFWEDEGNRVAVSFAIIGAILILCFALSNNINT